MTSDPLSPEALEAIQGRLENEYWVFGHKSRAQMQEDMRLLIAAVKTLQREKADLGTAHATICEAHAHLLARVTAMEAEAAQYDKMRQGYMDKMNAEVAALAADLKAAKEPR